MTWICGMQEAGKGVSGSTGIITRVEAEITAAIFFEEVSLIADSATEFFIFARLLLKLFVVLGPTTGRGTGCDTCHWSGPVA